MSGPLDVQVGGDHYRDMRIQPVTFITENGLGFLEGCVIKRMCRWRSKGGIEDLRKAMHEIELLIDAEENEQAHKNAYMTRPVDDEEEPDERFDQIREFFESIDQLSYAESDGIATIIPGVYRRSCPSVWWVLPHIFRADICNGLDYREVQKFGLRCGWLVPGGDGRPMQKVRMKGAHHPVWVYVIKQSILGGE